MPPAQKTTVRLSAKRPFSFLFGGRRMGSLPFRDSEQGSGTVRI
jgi:hypothetical protein